MSEKELVSEFEAYTSSQEISDELQEDMAPEAATWTTTTSSVPCAESVAATVVFKC